MVVASFSAAEGGGRAALEEEEEDRTVYVGAVVLLFAQRIRLALAEEEGEGGKPRTRSTIA